MLAYRYFVDFELISEQVEPRPLEKASGPTGQYEDTTVGPICIGAEGVRNSANGRYSACISRAKIKRD